MISLGSATRVFIVTGPTDMRKSFNGLHAIVQHKLAADATARLSRRIRFREPPSLVAILTKLGFTSSA